MLIKLEKIKLAGQNTGGSFSRKLFFHTDTNEALLKKTSVIINNELVKEDKSTVTRVKSIADKSGEITLF